MTTILYNKETEELEGDFREGWYKVDGVRPQLPDNIVELEVEYENMPSYDQTTQRVENAWTVDLVNNKYIREWVVIDLTQQEIDTITALEDWKEPNFVKRIVAPISLIMDDVGTKMYTWFTIDELPIKNLNNGTVHLYCNNILPEHQHIIDSLEGTVSVEDIPQILI